MRWLINEAQIQLRPSYGELNILLNQCLHYVFHRHVNTMTQYIIIK